MSKDDTILIKIGVSYKEGISAEDLYHATSVSWKISENKLQSGDYKYFCAVYNKKIKEIYELIGYEKDLHPDNLGRFILEGKIADESIRSKLMEKDVGEIHRGSGNPIKYASMDELLKPAEQEVLSDEESQEDLRNEEIEGNELWLKHLFMGLAKNLNEVKTLSSNKPNWITKVDESGVFVETLASRERFGRGDRKYPYLLITFDFIIEAWNEFIAVRAATADNFIKTKGRSSFIVAFFNELPFVENIKNEEITTIKLKEFTTDQLPEASLEQTIKLLDEIIHDNLDPKSISQKYSENATKRLKLRARQGLKILGFLNNDYLVEENTLKEYNKAINKFEYLSKRIKNHQYFTVIFDLLTLLDENNFNEKLLILSEIGMLIVRNSMGENQMMKSVSEYRTRNILNWFKETGMVDEEWNVESSVNNYSVEPNANMVIEERLISLPISKIITQIDNYIASKGFYYKKQEIENLYLSLRTKPFVILSGISGTGKTMIMKWLAESVGATEKNGQFTLIPVRPDWNDGSELLGYIDISGEFKEGPLISTIKIALDNPDKPFFVVLDEMNLARVEYYFSDVLSVMESRELIGGKIKSLPLIKKEIAGEILTFPGNVYIIGTVNMDETTHPFSKKVLDRANTIEFNDVNLDYLKFLGDITTIDPIRLHNDSFVSRYIHLKDVYNVYSDLVEKATNELVNINNILKGANVGYRVRDEICFYLAYNQQGNVMSFDQALDHCILQKILPRISGSDKRVDRTLKGLLEYFTKKKYGQDLELYEEELGLAKYPMSASKTFEMLRRLNDDGFTSFWNS